MAKRITYTFMYFVTALNCIDITCNTFLFIIVSMAYARFYCGTEFNHSDHATSSRHTVLCMECVFAIERICQSEYRTC